MFEWIGLIIVVAFIFALLSYFFPSIVAHQRGHKNALAIFLLNLFLGWTLIGWVGALIWAVLRE